MSYENTILQFESEIDGSSLRGMINRSLACSKSDMIVLDCQCNFHLEHISQINLLECTKPPHIDLYFRATFGEYLEEKTALDLLVPAILAPMLLPELGFPKPCLFEEL